MAQAMAAERDMGLLRLKVTAVAVEEEQGVVVDMQP